MTAAAGALTVVAFVGTALVTLRRPSHGLMVTLVTVGAASSVWDGVDAYFRIIRWGALAGLLAAGLVLERREPLRWPLASLLLLPVVAVPALSTVWSLYPAVTLQRSVAFAVMVAALALIAPRLDAAALALGAAIVTVLLVVSSFVYWALSSHALLGDQLRGPLQNPNTLGLAVAFLLALVAVAGARTRLGCAFHVTLVVAAAACIATSGSRTALLVVGVSLVVLAIADRRRLVPAAAAAVTAIAATLIFALTPLHVHGGGIATFVGVEQNPQLHRSGTATFLGGRNEAWDAAGDIVLRRPIGGFGFGTGEDHLFAHFGKTFVWFQGGGPSNGYLQAAMDLGICGAVLLIAPLLAAAAIGFGRAVHYAADPWPAALLAGGLVAAVFESTLTSAGAPWAYFVWLPAVAVLRSGAANDSVVDEVVPRLRMS